MSVPAFLLVPHDRTEPGAGGAGAARPRSGQVGGLRPRRREEPRRDHRAQRRLRAPARRARATSCSRPTCGASASAPTGTRPTSTAVTSTSSTRWPPARTRSRRTSGISLARSTCSSNTPLVDAGSHRHGRPLVRWHVDAVPGRVGRAGARRRRQRLLQRVARVPSSAVEPVRLAGAAGHARRDRARRPRRADRAASAPDRDRHRGPDLPRGRARDARWRASRAVYDALGVPERLEHDVFEGGHRWHGEHAYPFLERWLSSAAQR